MKTYLRLTYALLLLVGFAGAQYVAPSPTTTFAAETGNNTSNPSTLATPWTGCNASGSITPLHCLIDQYGMWACDESPIQAAGSTTRTYCYLINAKPQNVSNVTVKKLFPWYDASLGPNGGVTTRVYTHITPWFCAQGSNTTSSSRPCGHPFIGVVSNTLAQVQATLADLQRRGLDGFAIDWSGDACGVNSGSGPGTSSCQIDQVAQMAIAQAGNYGLKGFMNLEGTLSRNPCGANPTAANCGGDCNRITTGPGEGAGICTIADKIAEDLLYAKNNYFGSANYQKLNGANLVYNFSYAKVGGVNVDWAAIRTYVNASGGMALIFNGLAGGNPYSQPYTLEGGFGWVPRRALTCSNYSPEEIQLNHGAAEATACGTTETCTGFDNMLCLATKSIAAGNKYYDVGLVTSFDNRPTPWGAPNDGPSSPANTKPHRCGREITEQFKALGTKYNINNQPAAAQLNTWNDYDEGSEWETGTDNCMTVAAAVNTSGQNPLLQWDMRPFDPDANGPGTVVTGTGNVLPRSNHVVVVMLENRGYTTVTTPGIMPWLMGEAAQYTQLSNYFSVGGGGSLLEYLEVSSGSQETQSPQLCNGSGCGSGSTPYDPSTLTAPVTSNNIFRILNGAGLKWKVYQEGLASVGFMGTGGNQYTARHNPAPWYNDLNCASTTCSSAQVTNQQKMVPFTQLATDIANNTLPNYSFITPNLCNDAHGGTGCAADSTLATVADTWMKNNISQILSSPNWQPGGDGQLWITFDECGSGTNGGCSAHVLTVVIGPQVKKGFIDGTLYTHDNLLHTMLTALGQTVYPGASVGKADMSTSFIQTATNTGADGPATAQDATTDTIDHFDIYVSGAGVNPADNTGKNLSKLATVPKVNNQFTGYSLDLGAFRFPAGTYIFYVKEVSISGLWNKTSAPISVTIQANSQPPVCNVTVTPSSGTAPLFVTAETSGSTDPDNSITGRSIFWGDGSPNTVISSGTSATHTFAAGSWSVIATCTDATNLSSTDTKSVTSNLAANAIQKHRTNSVQP